ncbi:C40 family peptidase [bacterium]
MKLNKKIETWIRINILILLTLVLGHSFISCTGSYYPAAVRKTYSRTETRQLVKQAKSYLGTPYRWGGDDRSGMDCSGLVVRVYQDTYQWRLPHKSSLLYKEGSPVSLRSLEVGDLVFFHQDRGNQISHVGIYLGNRTFIHATTSRGVVLSKLDDRYYRARYMGARRLKR